MPNQMDFVYYGLAIRDAYKASLEELKETSTKTPEWIEDDEEEDEDDMFDDEWNKYCDQFEEELD